MTTDRNAPRPATYAQWVARYGHWYATDDQRAAEYGHYLDNWHIAQAGLRP